MYKCLIIILTIIIFGSTIAYCFAEVSPDSLSESAIPEEKHLKLWGEFYNESTILQKNRDNLISFSHIRQGLRVDRMFKITAELYLLLRYGKDLHRDFWNNRFETGLGLRVRLPLKVFLAIYLESIRGYYVKVPAGYPQPGQKEYNDIRSGLIFWYGWDRYYSASRFLSFPLTYWGDIYSDISYYRSQRNNVIGYFHTKAGFSLLRLWKSTIATYGVVYLMKDINRDFWNNKCEIGPGIWFSPLQVLDLKIFVEWLRGYYFGIEGEDPNPYPQHYRDRRIGIIFWIGW